MTILQYSVSFAHPQCVLLSRVAQHLQLERLVDALRQQAAEQRWCHLSTVTGAYTHPSFR